MSQSEKVNEESEEIDEEPENVNDDFEEIDENSLDLEVALMETELKSANSRIATMTAYIRRVTELDPNDELPIQFITEANTSTSANETPSSTPRQQRPSSQRSSQVQPPSQRLSQIQQVEQIPGSSSHLINLIQAPPPPPSRPPSVSASLSLSSGSLIVPYVPPVQPVQLNPPVQQEKLTQPRRWARG
ncbi:hypothetical protein PV325_012455, partial [Microctonus aethiopoides]